MSPGDVRSVTAGLIVVFKWLIRISLASSLVLSGYGVLPRAIEAISIFGFRNDPVQMLLYRLLDLDKAAYEKEIDGALAKDDPELARSLADLARDRGIPIGKDRLQHIAEAEEFSITRTAGQLWTGAVTGEAASHRTQYKTTLGTVKRRTIDDDQGEDRLTCNLHTSSTTSYPS